MDKILAEIVKNLDEDTKNSVFNILNESYKYGEILANFIHIKTITLSKNPKKGNSFVCSNHKTIVLLSYPFMILLNVVKNRVKKKIAERIDENQFRF